MTTSNTPIYASQARPWLKFYDQKYIDQTMPACTAFELVCRQNKNRLGETALEYYGRKFTYADFIVNVKKTAAALRAAGLKKGDIATVVSVMTPEIIFAFYAADMIGATLNLVDPRYSVEGIREYIEEVDSHLLICLNVVYERCHQAAKRTHVEHVVVLSPADSLPLPLALGYKIKNLDKNKYHSNVIHWKQFLAEYYAEEENPVEALVASEAELAISGSLIHGNEETRTIDFEEQKAENSAETELTPEQKYIQTGKELGYGKDDHDDPSAIEGFEFIDTPAYIDNSQSDTDKDAAEELSEEEVVAGFEFETEKVEPEESYLEDVPMFKQKRLEDE